MNVDLSPKEQRIEYVKHSQNPHRYEYVSLHNSILTRGELEALNVRLVHLYDLSSS